MCVRACKCSCNIQRMDGFIHGHEHSPLDLHLQPTAKAGKQMPTPHLPRQPRPHSRLGQSYLAAIRQVRTRPHSENSDEAKAAAAPPPPRLPRPRPTSDCQAYRATPCSTPTRPPRQYYVCERACECMPTLCVRMCLCVRARTHLATWIFAANRSTVSRRRRFCFTAELGLLPNDPLPAPELWLTGDTPPTHTLGPSAPPARDGERCEVRPTPSPPPGCGSVLSLRVPSGQVSRLTFR